MVYPLRTWSVGRLGGASALLSACMVLAAVPAALITRSTTVVTNLLFDAPLLLLPTMLAMNHLLRQAPARFRRSVLIFGLVGWTVLLADTVVYDLVPLFGFATDVWANKVLMGLLPIRNGLVFVGYGGWMVGSGVVWKIAGARLPGEIGWIHIAAGAPWMGMGLMMWSMTGRSENPMELPSLLVVSAQGLLLLAVLAYFGWTVTFGRWLRQQ